MVKCEICENSVDVKIHNHKHGEKVHSRFIYLVSHLKQYDIALLVFFIITTSFSAISLFMSLNEQEVRDVS